MKKEIRDAHFKLQTARLFISDALKRYISETKIDRIIDRYENSVIIETGGQLQLAFNDDETKDVKIPSIQETKIGDFTIQDVSPREYSIISPIMGMIVNCCAYPGGSGSLLCKAAMGSPWFKTMLIKKGEEVQGLTVVCSDTEEKTLIILGLEIAESNLSRSKKDAFRNLIEYSAREMLSHSNYQQVLFSAGGKGLPNIGFGSKPKFQEAKTYDELKELASLSNQEVIDTSVTDFQIKNGKKYGFQNLSDIPESAVCVKLAERERSLNNSNRNTADASPKLNLQNFDVALAASTAIDIPNNFHRRRAVSLSSLSSNSSLSL